MLIRQNCPPKRKSAETNSKVNKPQLYVSVWTRNILKTDKLFENVNGTIIMRDLSDARPCVFWFCQTGVEREHFIRFDFWQKTEERKRLIFRFIRINVHRLYEAFLNLNCQQWINLKTPSLRFRLWTKTFYPFFNGQNQEPDHAHRLLLLKLEIEREKNKMLPSLLRLPW